MANSEAVRLALEKAAQRAQRHAELDAAIAVMERLLNIELLSLEMLPWGCAFRYAHKKTKHHVIWVSMYNCSQMSRLVVLFLDFANNMNKLN